jgi:hypothetical protein
MNPRHLSKALLSVALFVVGLLAGRVAGAAQCPSCSGQNVSGPGEAISLYAAGCGWSPQDQFVYTTPGATTSFSVTALDKDVYGDPQPCIATPLTYHWTDSQGGSKNAASYDFIPVTKGTYWVMCEVIDPPVPILGDDTTHPVVFWTVYALSVRIKKGAVDITNQTLATIVGRNISLTAEIDPPVYAPSAYQWTIPQKRIKDYQPTLASAAVTNLQGADLNQSSISYYWVDGGDGRNVECGVTVAGLALTGATTFNVQRPATTVTVTHSPVITIGLLGDANRMAYYSANPAQRGIQLVRTPNPPSGVLTWFQRVDSTSSEKKVNAGTVYRATMANVCDGALPIPETLAPPALGMGDSPGILTSDNWSVKKADSFSTFLMFTPADENMIPGIPVPLWKVNWSWSGEGERNFQGDWTLVSSGHTVSAPVDCTTEPEWQGNVGSVAWVSAPVITTSNLEVGSIGQPYSQTLTADGGMSPISWAILVDALPSGLSLTGAVISGTPTSSGTLAFTVGAADSSAPPFNASRRLQIHIEEEP